MPWILSTFDLCTYYLFSGLFCCYFELEYFFLEVLMQQVCQIIKQQLNKHNVLDAGRFYAKMVWVNRYTVLCTRLKYLTE